MRRWRSQRACANATTILETIGLTDRYRGQVRLTVSQVMMGTGARLSGLTAEDLIGYNQARNGQGVRDASGLHVIWRAMRQLGWLVHESPSMPVESRGRQQLTVEEIVDQYQVRSPQREVLVEYLKARSPP